MRITSKPIKTLDDLFVHTLQDIYYAEQQIVKALPDMVKKAHTPQLRDAFAHHLEETKGQVRRLEQLFEMHGEKAKAVQCQALDGILAEAKEITAECGDENVRDAAMLAAAQAVEHYEIARYGTLIAYASQLGKDEYGKLLNETLAEEKAADKKLSSIGESRVNRKAA